MGSMDDILRRSLLFDFYGELLTEHQKEVYEAFDSDDMSLSEIAEEYGISRQGVHDLIKRTNHTLEMYEEKLGLVDRFMAMRETLKEIDVIASEMYTPDGDRISSLVEILLDEI